MRSKPYRNDRIINVIRDLYFTGGAFSFAHKFKYLFECIDGHHEVAVYKVPIPMVALVATAVSYYYLCVCISLLTN